MLRQKLAEAQAKMEATARDKEETAQARKSCCPRGCNAPAFCSCHVLKLWRSTVLWSLTFLYMFCF